MEHSEQSVKMVVEAALLAAGRPLTFDQLCDLYVTSPPESEEAKIEREAMRPLIKAALKTLSADCAERGIELVEVASGHRFQVKPKIAERVSHLWATRPSRYSRALLETLALIAYRQPITRSEIESVRGVSVSTQIIASMMEYGWIRVVGHRNTPGRPKLYGTTRAFLDQFGLKNLKDLPELPEVRELAPPQGELALDAPAEVSLSEDRGRRTEDREGHHLPGSPPAGETPPEEALSEDRGRRTEDREGHHPPGSPPAGETLIEEAPPEESSSGESSSGESPREE